MGMRKRIGCGSIVIYSSLMHCTLLVPNSTLNITTHYNAEFKCILRIARCLYVYKTMLLNGIHLIKAKSRVQDDTPQQQQHKRNIFLGSKFHFETIKVGESRAH